MNDKTQSCHPRVVNGRTAFPKVNTAAATRKGIAPAKLANMEKHLAEHPRDAMTAARIAKNAKG